MVNEKVAIRKEVGTSPEDSPAVSSIDYMPKYINAYRIHVSLVLYQSMFKINLSVLLQPNAVTVP